MEKQILLVFKVLVLLVITSVLGAEPELSVVETEPEADRDNLEKRSNTYFNTRIGTISSCAPFQTCLPLAQCVDSHYELAKSCLLTGDRSSVCGYTDGSEPLTCCNRRGIAQDGIDTLPQFGPITNNNNPPSFVSNLDGINSMSCGRSLIQSQFYRGLGAFPFVARIGFKSTQAVLDYCEHHK